MRNYILSRLCAWLRPVRKPLLEPIFLRFINTKHGRTRELYECTLRRLHAFNPDFSRFPVEAVTADWLRAFDAFLSQSAPSPNARAIHLRNVRTVYYLALDDGTVAKNPFRRFRIRTEPTRKRALTAAQLRRLASIELDPWLAKYRDAFLLMFMLRGINAVDFCRLDKIEGGMIRYRRAKTGRLFEIRVEPEAVPLIRSLRGKGQLLYPLDRVADYRRYTARLNAALRRISSMIPGFPAITTYWARHSWASIAASLDIPKETIAAALGHAPTSVTDIYISFDMRKVHRANRKVITHVFGKREEAD